jgi:hypothetical protein
MSRTCLIAVAAASALLAAQASATTTISKSFVQSAHLSVNASASGCENHPGPFITLDGGLTFSGLTARIILTNNAKFTHVGSADVSADVQLIPFGQTLTFHKAPPQGGAGGNPWIYFQFTDPNGGGLSPLVLLGRCNQGLSPDALDLILPQLTNATITAGGCTNSGGPNITLDGALVLGGLNGKIVLTNNAKFTHVASADVVINVVLIPEGQSLTFHKQPPLGGAGGNPIIYIQFLGGNGNALTDPIKLGRCNQL